MHPPSIIKSGFVFIALIFIHFNVFGQVNKFKQDKLDDDKTTHLNLKNKIKEIDGYFMKVRDGIVYPDSALFSRTFINNKGNTFKRIFYGVNALNGQITQTIDTMEYDNNERKIRSTYNGKQRSSIYAYDKRGLLIKEDKISYEYDERGNVILSKDKLSNAIINKYEYNNRNEVVKYLTFRENTPAMIKRDEFSYVYNNVGIVQIESAFNEKNELTAKKEFVYDTKGNKLKEYNIENGNKKQVFECVYNSDNQLIEILRPCTAYLPKIERENLNEHLYYTYNKEGNLLSITTCFKDLTTGKESLQVVQKNHYLKH